MNLDALLNLVTQDVNEVGGLVNVVFGHETDVEEGSAVMGTHGFKLCRRVRAGVGSLVDPLDKVAALVIGKEPNGTGTGNVDFGLGDGIVDAVPNMSA